MRKKISNTQTSQSKLNRIFGILLIILASCSLFDASAQDTEFWFVAPQLDDKGASVSNNFNRPVYFMITAGDLPATVTMEMPALTGFHNRVLHLAAHQSERIVFGADYTEFSNAQMDTIQNNIRNVQYVGVGYNRGIHFTATAPVTVYYQVNSLNSKDMFALKGMKALGNEFYTPFQTLFQSHSDYPNAYAQFHIVATENNTSIAITPAADIVGTPAGTTKNIVLNRGETFAARTVSFLQATRLAGSHIVSDKPVSVTVCDDLLRVAGSLTASDVTGDQIVPVDKLGTSYVVVRGFAAPTAPYCDQVFILATQNNTKVSVDGAQVSTLNAGQQHVHAMPSALTAVITADHPVYVYHFSGYGTTNYTEVGAALIPSMYAINARRISFYKDPTAVFNSVSVLVRDGNEDGFTVNGSASVLVAGDFASIPYMAGWKYARKNIQSVASGTVTVNNSKGAFALGYFYTGTTVETSTSYGYLSQYGTLTFADTTWQCNNAPVTLDAGYAKTYYWTLPDNSHSTSSTVISSDTGTYTVVVDQDPFQVTASTKVLNRFEGSGILSSSINDIGGGTFTYTASAGLYNENHVSYTWKVDGVQTSTDKAFTTVWNKDDEHEITLVLYDAVLNCTKTHTLIHYKLDNVSDAQCFGEPPVQQWGIQEIPMNKTKLIHNYGPLVTGDIDNDGITEIIGFMPKTGAQNRYDSDGLRMFIMNGGQVQFKKDIAFSGHTVSTFGSAAIARYNDVGYIVVCGVDRYLYAYNASTDAQIWKSDALATESHVGTIVNIADFNGDGIPEVYAGNKIFSLDGGKLLCSGGAHNTGALLNELGHSTVAADITGDGKLELCAGTQIYRVSIPQGAITDAGCSMAVITDMEFPATSLPANAVKDGATQVADIDNDGKLEVVVVSKSTGNLVVVYVWKPLPAHASQLLGSYLVSATNISYYAIPMIGNIDDTPYPEIVFITNGSEWNMYALKYDPASAPGNRIGIKWTLGHTDGSGCTGATLFDFDQNGMNEIVYRDETTLRIIDGSGTTAVAKNTFTHVYSCTLRELPVIADVDGDGQAEIVVQGGDEHVATVEGITLDPSSCGGKQNGYLRVFKSPTKWAPARKVWNQYAYNAVNVNEDLTIPRYQLNPATVFPGANGSLGDIDDVRPYNNFLQQQTTLNIEGEPLWLTPDFVLFGTPGTHYYAAGDSLVISNICVRNDGDARGDDNIKIAVYRNSRATANLIAAYTLPAGINIGATRCYSIRIDGASSLSSANLLVVLNDDGAQYPQDECKYQNNELPISFASIPRARNDRITVFACGSKTVDVLANDLGFGSATPLVVQDGKLGTATVQGTSLVYANDKNVDGGCMAHGGRRDTVVYRVCAPSGNCADGSLFVEILHKPSILLLDSCSHRPCLTLNYQYAETAYTWYSSSDGFTWAVIAGSQQRNICPTTDAWFKCEINHNGESFETTPAHFVVRRKVRLPPGNVWWYDTYLN